MSEAEDANDGTAVLTIVSSDGWIYRTDGSDPVCTCGLTESHERTPQCRPIPPGETEDAP